MKKQKLFYLTTESIDEIKKIANQDKITESQVVENLLTNYKILNDENLLVKKFLNSYEEKYKDLFTGLRLATRQAEKNSTILLECINTLLISQNTKQYFSTNKNPSPVLNDAIITVNERIAKYKQRSDNKKMKSGE